MQEWNKINKFQGKYFFLSNFYPCKVKYRNVEYNNAEAAYQAQKTTSNIERLRFAKLDAKDAKRLGNQVILRCDWEDVKINIMRDVLKCKFDNNPDLKNKLLATDKKELIEGNWWHDKFWGISEQDGKGANWLGKLLMELRQEYVKIKGESICYLRKCSLCDVNSEIQQVFNNK